MRKTKEQERICHLCHNTQSTKWRRVTEDALIKCKDNGIRLEVGKYLCNICYYELRNNKLYLKQGQQLVIPKNKELRTNIQKYITSCDSCQRNKSNNKQPAGLLQPLSTPLKHWEQVMMDFIVQLPTTCKGYDAIVVIVDHLSKHAHFCPIHTSVTTPEVAKIFFSTIFKNHGLPQVIISDIDAKFTSHFWKTLFEQTEQMNRTLEEMLCAYSSYKQDNWDEYLPAAEFAYNNSKQPSTGHTPFELDCGQHPNTPSSLAAKKTLKYQQQRIS
nr:10086_t:CDS:2 [Entrophospora candida]